MCMWIDRPNTVAENQDKTQERLAQLIPWAEKLNEVWWGPIFVLHGWGPGGWAVAAAELVAYLENENNPLPKAIVWSSAGSFLWVMLRHSVKDVVLSDGTSEDNVRYENELRYKMSRALRDVFTEKLPKIIEETSKLDVVKWILKGLVNKNMDLDTTYSVLWIDTPFPSSREENRHFDLIVTYTDAETWKARLIANGFITTEIWDGSSAFNGKKPEYVWNGKYARDGNYSDYWTYLSWSILPWEEIRVITSYSSIYEQESNCQTIDDKLMQRACDGNAFISSWIKNLQATTQDFTVVRNVIPESDRSSIWKAPVIFAMALARAKEREQNTKG